MLLMIPIVAIVMGIGIGMLALLLGYLKRREMFALHHKERMAAIEKGIELPPLPDAFFTEDGKPPDAPVSRCARPSSPHRHLLTGLKLVFGGLALAAACHFEFQAHAVWGLILTALGLAYLIYYAAVGRKEALEEAARIAQAQPANPPKI